MSSTDASEHGWGWAESQWPTNVVREVGRTSERSRFKETLSGPNLPARDSAFQAAGLGSSLDVDIGVENY